MRIQATKADVQDKDGENAPTPVAVGEFMPFAPRPWAAMPRAWHSFQIGQVMSSALHHALASIALGSWTKLASHLSLRQRPTDCSVASPLPMSLGVSLPDLTQAA